MTELLLNNTCFVSLFLGASRTYVISIVGPIDVSKSCIHGASK